jgi:hypothetical protein
MKREMLHKQPLGNTRTRQSDKARYEIKKSQVLMRKDITISSIGRKR